MSHATLLPDPAELRLDHLISESNAVTVVVQTTREAVPCPDCQHPSRRVHSHYIRTLADLPWSGVAVRLRLHTRRFFCSSLTCSRRVFTERLPGTAGRYARRTLRFEEALQILGLLVGGEPGARLAQKLGLRTSGDTLLRHSRQHTAADPPTPRVLGVDDWAWKRGSRYGTILVDLERRRPIELLPDREAGTLAAWLQQHAGVQVVTRDRATYYADGITAGAPGALQVADRFHLVQNLREAIERVLQRERGVLREAAPILHPKRARNESLKKQNLPPLRRKDRPRQRSAKELLQQQARRAQRVARYEEIKQLRAEGHSLSAIARRMGMQRATVRLFLRADEYPEARPGTKPSKVQPFAKYLEERWREGCHNARQLYREIKARGYNGHVQVLQAYLASWRKLLPEEIRRRQAVPQEPPPAPRTVSWWLLLAEEKLREPERAFVAEITSRQPVLKTTQTLAREFRRLLQARDEPQFDQWLAAVEASEISELQNFAQGLRRDEAAVRAAMQVKWSNGQTEGQVNRLKLLKRQMFGRAKFDLLKKRVLYKAA
jgi:transposase